jgi:hypothetical protein
MSHGAIGNSRSAIAIYPNIKIPKAHPRSCKALGQVYNVLIILAITLLMAVVTALIAYFADVVPAVVDNGTHLASNTSIGSQVSGAR